LLFAANACAIAPTASSAQTASKQPVPELDCLIDVSARVKVSAGVPGLIRHVTVDRGDVVRAGDVLVELDSAVEQATYTVAAARAQNDQPLAAARAKQDNARRAAERFQRLKAVNAGAVTDADLQEAIMDARVADASVRDAELTLESARLEADRARALVEQKRVASPISGVVVERLMSAGEYRHEQAHILTLARLDPLHVEVFVPIAYFAHIRPKLTATILPEAPIGGQYSGEVTIVDRIFDAASGTFGVRLTLPNPTLDLPAGLRCRVRFDSPKG
jgi:RND family efflux transporter MFP subunit